MKVLTDEDIQAGLAGLPGWTGDARAITAEYGFESYGAGVAFAVQVALLAERADHHPDLNIGWRRVRVSYSTHVAGGVTRRDLDAAGTVAAIAPR